MRKLFDKIIFAVIKFTYVSYQKYRIFLFGLLSNNQIQGVPRKNTPCLFLGKGKIIFGKNVTLGIFPSPDFYTGSLYIESRSDTAEIIIGKNVFINNNFRLCCDKSKITIGDDCLIGTNVEIIDSDFHELHPLKRNSGNHKCKEVIIGNNVFIGSNVVILKGVHIGDNSIISNFSIVKNDVPENSICGGVETSFIKEIKS